MLRQLQQEEEQIRVLNHRRKIIDQDFAVHRCRLFFYAFVIFFSRHTIELLLDSGRLISMPEMDDRAGPGGGGARKKGGLVHLQAESPARPT